MPVRGWLKFLGMLCALLCLSCAALAHQDEIYFMGPDDPYYHAAPDCPAADGSMYQVTPEAAREFCKVPCAQCALELETQAVRANGALVIKAVCGGEAALSVDNANCAREIDGAYYFVLADYSADSVAIKVDSAGGSYYCERPLNEAQARNACVASIDRDADTFCAFDVFGLRLCKYSRYSNADIMAAEVLLDPETVKVSGGFDEFTGEYSPEYEIEYGLRIPVMGYADRGIAHFWLLTRDEYSRMETVTIAGSAGEISGSVYFQPFYTGDETVSPMGDAQPWEISADGSAHAESYDDTEKIERQDDYCGHYLNCSGTYTVVVKNPTKKRAREYARMLDGDIWVVQGEYTWDELTKAMKKAAELLESHMAAAAIDPVSNRVECDVYGADVARFADAGLFSPCVNVYYAGELIWERGEMAAENESVPYAPISGADIDGINARASMGRGEYPPECEYISFNVELSSGFCALELGGGLEKYVDGEWKSVAGEYAPMDLNCLTDTFETARTVITRGTWSYMIPTGKYEKLGAGLYRLRACRVEGGEYADLEFVITPDAAPLEKYAELKPQNPKPTPAAHLPVHSAPGYSSLTDDFEAFSAGGWEYRLVRLPADIWAENRPCVSAVIVWPEEDPSAVQKIFEIKADILRMFDTGDGIFLAGANDFCRISYDGGEFETLFTTKKSVKKALMVGDELYYMTDDDLWVYRDGAQEKLWSPKKGTGDMLEYYDDTLYAANAAGKTVTVLSEQQ
jgi:hypothetical protein